MDKTKPIFYQRYNPEQYQPSSLRRILDFLSCFVISDILTYGASTRILIKVTNVVNKCLTSLSRSNSYTIIQSLAYDNKANEHCMIAKIIGWMRWPLIIWAIYRICRVILAIRRVRTRLNKKRKNIDDKHFHLYNKLIGLQKIAHAHDHQPITGVHDGDKLDGDQLGLTRLPLSELRSRLRARKLTAIDLLDAFQTSAIIQWRAQTGCIAEVVYEADVTAILADETLAIAAEDADVSASLSPLHGIPISLKEIIPIAGYDHCMGYVSATGQPAENDCALVKALKAAGAIPFVRTNMAQLSDKMDCWNPVFGRPIHPTHPDRMVGASSGGEAALLARGGSPVGLGTDLLGSLRFPIAFCGGCSLKPTPLRVTNRGLDTIVQFSQLRRNVCGPMGRHVDDLADVMRVLFSDLLFQLDASVPRLYFNETVYNNTKRPLRIGYFLGFPGLVQPVPSVQRAVLDTKALLERLGHQLIEFTVPSISVLVELYMALYSASISQQTWARFYGCMDFDIMDSNQRLMHLLIALPNTVRAPLVWLHTKINKNKNPLVTGAFKGIMTNLPLNVIEAMVLDYETEFFAAWDELELDACLSPVTVCPAPRLTANELHILAILPHCALYNLVNAPAGVVTVGKVTRNDELAAAEALSKAKKTPEEELNATVGSAQMWSHLLTDQVGSQGLPLAVQVAAKPCNDELVLWLLKEIETANGSSL